jgi:hypothetical protein
MKTPVRYYFLAILVIGLGTALWATSPETSKHFILTNGNDYMVGAYGTRLKLLGSGESLSLITKNVFATGGMGNSGSVPDIQIIQHGPDTCAFLSDAVTEDIASFLYPSFTKVGNYVDSAIMPNSQLGIVLAARGNYLFAGYDGQSNDGGRDPVRSVDGQIGVWRIRRGCTLTLVNTYTATYPIFSMAVSPNGSALVISYSGDYFVGSYGIGPDGTLTGPYNLGLGANGYAPWGVDITADSKYAIIDLQSNYTAVDLFPINSNGSLDTHYYQFGGNESLGKAPGGGWIWLSPNEKFLFVTDNSHEVITLGFNEADPSQGVTYSGCMTTLRVPKDDGGLNAFGMATELASDAGGVLYVAEGFDYASIATLTIDPNTGCTTETAASPFELSNPNVAISTIVAWPPRPF